MEEGESKDGYSYTTADNEMSKEFLEEVDDGPVLKHSSLQQHSIESKEEECTAEIASTKQNAPEPADNMVFLTTEQNIVKHKIFQLAGDDVNGRPVIAFSMSRLPPRTEIDHDVLLDFMKDLLDQYVESDYTIVYFHFGLNSKNKPSLRMLVRIYNELDRKYKKNLKSLLIVHPSNFIKIVMTVLNPLISTKFGKKISYINRLDELKAYVRLEQLDIPKEVMKYDEEVGARTRVHSILSNSIFYKAEDSKTKQFGVSVKVLKERTDQPIPIAVQSTADFIINNALDVEGIFRRSTQANIMEEAVATFNLGATVEFSKENVHLAPALLKKFLRDLPEPLLTFALYDKVMESCTLSDEERLPYTYKMLNEDLPEENRVILIFLLQFLQLVIEHTSNNRMNSGSLAIVLGPNLLWSKDQVSSLTSMSKINSFTKYLIDNSNLIFDESAA